MCPQAACLKCVHFMGCAANLNQLNLKRRAISSSFKILQIPRLT